MVGQRLARPERGERMLANEKFVQNAKPEVVEAEREKERVRAVEGKAARGSAMGDSAALYGVAGSLPNKAIVVDLARGFLDMLYKT